MPKLDLFDLADDIPDDYHIIGGNPSGDIVAPAHIIAGEEQGMTLREYEKEQGELRRHEQLTSMQDELFAGSMKNIRAMSMAAEINPEDPTIPDHWIQKFGAEDATIMHRVAMAGWQNKKNAPVFLDTDKAVVLGIIRAKATEKSGPKHLNVSVVNMTAPPMMFPEMDVTE